jgi:phosphatidate cytidylyltransferase
VSQATTESKAGRNLPVAVVVGAVLIALVLASLAFDRRYFAALVGAAIVICCWEWVRSVLPDHRLLMASLLMASAVAILVAGWDSGVAGLAVALAISFVAVAALRLTLGIDHYLRDTAGAALGLMYIPFLAGFALLLARPDDGMARVLTFIACVAANDTGGYFAGVLFGKHRLAPSISPKKTWEGLAGSVLLALVAGVLTMTLLMNEAWWKGALLAGALVLSSTFGDLVESAIKRDLKIKDMGSFLPGHGGVLDRIDALLLSAPIGWLMLSMLVP